MLFAERDVDVSANSARIGRCGKIQRKNRLFLRVDRFVANVVYEAAAIGLNFRNIPSRIRVVLNRNRGAVVGVGINPADIDKESPYLGVVDVGRSIAIAARSNR